MFGYDDYDGIILGCFLTLFYLVFIKSTDQMSRQKSQPSASKCSHDSHEAVLSALIPCYIIRDGEDAIPAFIYAIQVTAKKSPPQSTISQSETPAKNAPLPSTFSKRQNSTKNAPLPSTISEPKTTAKNASLPTLNCESKTPVENASLPATSFGTEMVSAIQSGQGSVKTQTKDAKIKSSRPKSRQHVPKMDKKIKKRLKRMAKLAKLSQTIEETKDTVIETVDTRQSTISPPLPGRSLSTPLPGRPLTKLYASFTSSSEPEDKKLDLHGLFVDEALEDFIEFFNDMKEVYTSNGCQEEDRYIYVVTGRGNGCTDGVPKIKPAVQKVLDTVYVRYNWLNDGGLVMIDFCEDDYSNDDSEGDE